MNKKLVIFRVKEGKLSQWRSWTQELETTLRDEAIDSLREEQVVCEFFALIEIDDHHYTVGYMEGDMRDANMDRDINKKHQAMREECLERIANGEFLYHITNRLSL